jgi:hypothetical protein
MCFWLCSFEFAAEMLNHTCLAFVAQTAVLLCLQPAAQFNEAWTAPAATLANAPFNEAGVAT